MPRPPGRPGKVRNERFLERKIRLTPAQNNLLEIADWMVKASIGAILGLIGGRRLADGTPAGNGG